MPGAAAIKAGEAYVKIGGHLKPLNEALRAANAKLEDFGKRVRRLGFRLMGVGAAIAAPLGIAVSRFMEYGDQVAKIARRTGVSVDAIAELGYAAEISGSSLEALEKGFRRMGRAMEYAERGLATTLDALGILGLTYDDLRGKRPDEQFMIIAAALSRVQDASLKAGLAQEFFGRAGAELIPLLDLGADGLDKLRQRARDLGLTLGKSSADAERLKDAWTDVKSSLLGVAIAVGEALGPTLADLSNHLAGTIGKLANWAKENQTTVKLLATVAAVIATVTVALGGMAIAIYGVTAALAVLTAHPIVAVLTLIAAGIVGIIAAVKAWKGKTEEATDAQDDLKRRLEEAKRAAQEQQEQVRGLASTYDDLAEAKKRAAEVGKEKPLFPEAIGYEDPVRQLVRLSRMMEEAEAKRREFAQRIQQMMALPEREKLGAAWANEYRNMMRSLGVAVEEAGKYRKEMDEIKKFLETYMPEYYRKNKAMIEALMLPPEQRMFGMLGPGFKPYTAGAGPEAIGGVLGTFSGEAAALLGPSPIERQQLDTQKTMVAKLDAIEKNTRKSREAETAVAVLG